MQLNDDVTSLATRPVPKATVSPGYFNNVFPGTATVVDPDFLNGLQDELKNLLTAASITMDKTATNQVLSAIQSLISNAIGTPTVYSGTTASTGSANAQVVAATNPAGFTQTIGYSVTFVPGFNNTGSTTLNVDSTGVATIQESVGGSLVNLSGGELVAGTPVTVVWNGTVFVLQTGALGQAAFKGVTNNALTNAMMANGSFTVGDVLIAADTNGSAKDGGKRGTLWAGTSGGSANAQTLSPSPYAPAAYVAGDSFSFIAGFTNIGAMTLNNNSLGTRAVQLPSGNGPIALIGGEVVAGNIITVRDTGTAYLITEGAAINNATFDLSSPPGADVALAVGQKVRVTFSAVSAVALHIATSPGLYKITLHVTADTSANVDLHLQPNNANYSGAFSTTALNVTDGTTTVAPFVSGPVAQNNSIGSNNFGLDLFSGPNTHDNINDIGPFMAELLVSTVTVAKMVKAASGILGGPASFFGKWNDTTTAWSSLGTFSTTDSGNLTGTAIVERVA